MPDPSSSAPQQSSSGCLARLCWMGLGNVALVLVALSIAGKHDTLFSTADAAFWGIVVMLLVVRYADIRWFQGQTADGHQAATMQHWRRYMLLVGAISLGMWLLAHLGAHFAV